MCRSANRHRYRCADISETVAATQAGPQVIYASDARRLPRDAFRLCLSWIGKMRRQQRARKRSGGTNKGEKRRLFCITWVLHHGVQARTARNANLHSLLACIGGPQNQFCAVAGVQYGNPSADSRLHRQERVA